MQLYLRISIIPLHIYPTVSQLVGKEEIMCQFPAIGVWVSMYPVHANSVLLNVISVRKLDIFPKLAGQIRTKQARDLQKCTKKTHYLAEKEELEEPVEHDSSYHLFTLQSNGQNPITVQVELNNILTEMEVDAGASVSLINMQAYLYDSIASKTPIQPLQKSEVKLKTYTGE